MPPTTTRRRPTASKPKAVRAQPTVIDEEGAEVVDLPGIVDHTVPFERDGEVEEHTFRAQPRMSYKRMADIVRARRSDDGVDALAAFERMIRPALLDDDGTPAKWKAEVRGGVFVDPEGNERPTEDLVDVLAFEAGSSKRRWIALLDQDDEVDVELDDIAGFYEVLVEAASDRPTRRPSRSSRR
jgi:hypothetical protein